MELLLCGYRNASDRMVIVRCIGPEAFLLERVVFPFELLTFHCPPGSDVEIRHALLAGREHLEALAAEDLLIREPEAPIRRDWWPRRPQRAVGVRDNASSISLEYS